MYLIHLEPVNLNEQGHLYDNALFWMKIDR